MCEDVPSPESSRPENGQCEWCHCLGNTKCSQCGKCKSCGKPVPFELSPVVPLVPSPWPTWSPYTPPIYPNPNVQITWIGDYPPNVNGGNYTTLSIQT